MTRLTFEENNTDSKFRELWKLSRKYLQHRNCTTSKENSKMIITKHIFCFMLLLFITIGYNLRRRLAVREYTREWRSRENESARSSLVLTAWPLARIPKRASRLAYFFLRFYHDSPGPYSCVGTSRPARTLVDKSFYWESQESSRLRNSMIMPSEEHETAWRYQAEWWLLR